ncbi:hypothetical protein SMSP2_02558 [Limihaloglobus sulfuriphilus]|uniref:Uncharacterized protein n=1 Tax=Limihaloglobus sulfuriphilus TaxID=1851148 RepID=A0A1Q2MIQ1_9BACT|nr:hypothetical protein [Limihaloglobus sulfuriphilus]AQQ72177.1 hypothetical protein SMSP2_02558 [Limihaloglobus sulfuriphilus]
MSKKNKTLYIMILTAAAGVCFAQSPRSLVNEGNRLYAQQDYPGAAELYEQAAESESAVAAYNLANARLKEGRLEDAVNAYLQALSLAGDQSGKLKHDIRSNLARAYYELSSQKTKEDPEAAISDLDSCISTLRDSARFTDDKSQTARNIELARVKQEMLRKMLEQQKQQQQKQQQSKQDIQDQLENQQQKQQQLSGQDPSEQQSKEQQQQLSEDTQQTLDQMKEHAEKYNDQQMQDAAKDVEKAAEKQQQAREQMESEEPEKQQQAKQSQQQAADELSEALKKLGEDGEEQGEKQDGQQQEDRQPQEQDEQSQQPRQPQQDQQQEQNGQPQHAEPEDIINKERENRSQRVRMIGEYKPVEKDW